MNMPTTEQLELQRTLDQWQNRQRVHGNVFLFLCLASLISFVLFCLDPCQGTTWLLLISLTLMVSGGASMFRAAHAVVQHKQLLQFTVTVKRLPDSRVLPAAAFYGNSTWPGVSFGRGEPWIQN